MGVVGLVELGESVALLALDEVDGRDLSDELIELFRLRSMLDAQVSRRVRAFDARGDAVNGGHRSTAAWLMDHCRCRPPDAYREVRVARAMRELDGIRDAWEAGRTTSEHVYAVEAARHAAKDDGAFGEYEPALVGLCESATVDDTTKVLSRWRDALDAHRQSDDTLVAKVIERRGLSMGLVMDTYGYAEATMDKADYAIFQEAIDIERERGHVEGDERTPTQQRLDALVAICQRTLDGQNPGGTNRPHLVIGTDPVTVAGIAVGRAETASGVHLPMSTVQRLACDALLTRVILDADSQPLDLGRAVRTFTFEQRKAMLLRDGGCCFPGCHRPASDCQAHHEPSWEDGGHTNIDAGFLGCWTHHRLLHEQHWTVKRNEDGSLDWYKPDGSVYGRWKPRPPPEPIPL